MRNLKDTNRYARTYSLTGWGKSGQWEEIPFHRTDRHLTLQLDCIGKDGKYSTFFSFKTLKELIKFVKRETPISKGLNACWVCVQYFESNNKTYIEQKWSRLIN